MYTDFKLFCTHVYLQIHLHQKAYWWRKIHLQNLHRKASHTPSAIVEQGVERSVNVNEMDCPVETSVTLVKHV